MGLSTKKEHKGIVEGISGSSAKVSSSFSMCLSDPSSSSSNGAFDDLSELISQLPIIHVKNGLSKYDRGKSESFKSLANVTSLKDLVKKESRISKGMLRQSRKKAYRTMKATTTSPSYSNSRLTLKPFHGSPKISS